MTEKRFEIMIGEFEEENIVDNLKGTIREISDMCKKMNELYEEKERLRNSNMVLMRKLAQAHSDIVELRKGIKEYGDNCHDYDKYERLVEDLEGKGIL